MTIGYDEIRDFIAREGYLLDSGRFEDWLELYAQESIFWVPAWNDDSDQQTQDPQQEISLIYYANRDGLADRVFRIRTGKSAASNPLFRTTHLTGNIVVENSEPEQCAISCAWVAYSYRQEKTLTYFGNTQYELHRVNDALKIFYKKIVLKNDRIDQVRFGIGAPGVNHARIRIGIEVMESEDMDALAFQQLARPFHVSGCNNASIRYQQAAMKAQVLTQ